MPWTPLIPCYKGSSIFKKNMKPLRGFTLIELLVVIAIIGILAGIILAAVGGARTSGNDARRISDIRQISYALGVYYSVNGSYPCGIYTGFACPDALTLAGSAGSTMKNPPKDPITGNIYSYAALGSGANCTGYHLAAALDDTNNQILTIDADTPVGAGVCTNSLADFSGLSTVSSGKVCKPAAGTPQPSGTETCYDVSQ
jgi:prepilin-type N-terminal cleavage/methylation domain-containing protein